MGDFFKGSVSQTELPLALKHGILLHRQIDSFTDQHPFVKSLKQQMPEHRRYGGIILDVLFDHELAMNFGQYHDQTLTQFVTSCTRQFDINPAIMSPRFVSVLTQMKQSNWLIDYQHIDVIEQVLNRIGQRLSKPMPLGESIHWYRSVKDSAFVPFADFYQELQVFSQHSSASLYDELMAT